MGCSSKKPEQAKATTQTPQPTADTPTKAGTCCTPEKPAEKKTEKPGKGPSRGCCGC